MNDLAKKLLTWAIIAIVLVSIFNHYASVGTTPESLSYSQFLANVRNGEVVEVHVQSTNSGNNITGTNGDGSEFQTFGPPDDKLVDDLVENNVEFSAEPPAERSILVDLGSGHVVHDRAVPRPGLREMNFLHLNHPKKGWTWAADIYAVALGFLAVSGMLMMRGKTLRRGVVLTAIGFILPLLFLALYL